jgi:hypothetical protein
LDENVTLRKLVNMVVRDSTLSWRFLNTPQSMLAKELLDWVEAYPGRTLQVLDCGAGGGGMWLTGNLGKFIQENKDRVSVTLLDAVAPEPKGLSEDVFIQKVGLLPQALQQFPENAFDLAFAFDVIEHLAKSDGYLLLYELDRVAKDKQIIYTPTGFLWQPPSKNNPYNAHVSGWTPRELRSLGWTNQTGLMGFKWLMAPYGAQRFEPTSKVLSFMLRWVMKLSQGLARPFPSWAHSFFAVKGRKNPRVLEQVL